MPVEWPLPETPDAFREWLAIQDPERELGMAGGYKKHPIAIWLASRGHEVLLGALDRANPCVYLWDARGERLITAPADHWITRFSRALLPPDVYRRVTASECLEVLARVLNQ